MLVVFELLRLDFLISWELIIQSSHPVFFQDVVQGVSCLWFLCPLIPLSYHLSPIRSLQPFHISKSYVSLKMQWYRYKQIYLCRLWSIVESIHMYAFHTQMPDFGKPQRCCMYCYSHTLFWIFSPAYSHRAKLKCDCKHFNFTLRLLILWCFDLDPLSCLHNSHFVLVVVSHCFFTVPYPCKS